MGTLSCVWKDGDSMMAGQPVPDNEGAGGLNVMCLHGAATLSVHAEEGETLLSC